MSGLRLSIIIMLLIMAVRVDAQPPDPPPGWITYITEGDIYRTRSDGSDTQLFIKTEGYPVAWSPDGEWLLVSFADDTTEHASHLELTQVSRTERHRMTDEPIDGLSHVVWSPDGEWIVYTSCPDGYMHDCDLYRVRSDGTDQAHFTESPGDNQHPAWSPDSEWLLFSAYDGQSRHTYRIRPDGSDMQNLTESTGGGWSAVWSPDGEWIAFISDYDLYRMRSNGSEVTRLTQDTNIQGGVVWSPDSEWILFEARLEGASSLDIYRINSDGTSQSRLTKAGGSRAVWSPDGEWIVFQSRRNQNMDIFLLYADGGDPQQLTHSPDDERDPNWLPDQP